jgi:cation diffusion facilitator family transporter
MIITAASRAGRGELLSREADGRRTVVVAMAANLGVAAAKLIAGTLTASSAMMAESFHAIADTGNEALLLIAQWRGDKPPDEQHPLGHGREAYFWALLASLGVFVTGALLSLRQGINTLINPVDVEHFPVAYIVLAISFALDGMSLLRVYRQIKRDADGLQRDFFEQYGLTSDPVARAVFAEDAAAIAGNVIALAGIALHQITGSPVPDGVAAILIAAVLAYVAFELVRRNRDFIIGQQAPEGLRQRAREIILSQPGILGIGELISPFLGPRKVWVSARIDIDESLTGAQVKELLRSTEDALMQWSPYIMKVYLTPTGER